METGIHATFIYGDIIFVPLIETYLSNHTKDLAKLIVWLICLSKYETILQCANIYYDKKIIRKKSLSSLDFQKMKTHR
jgi:hypothetical protein